MVDEENQPDLIPIQLSTEEIQAYQTDVVVIGIGGAGGAGVRQTSGKAIVTPLLPL